MNVTKLLNRYTVSGFVLAAVTTVSCSTLRADDVDASAGTTTTVTAPLPHEDVVPEDLAVPGHPTTTDPTESGGESDVSEAAEADTTPQPETPGIEISANYLVSIPTLNPAPESAATTTTIPPAVPTNPPSSVESGEPSPSTSAPSQSPSTAPTTAPRPTGPAVDVTDASVIPITAFTASLDPLMWAGANRPRGQLVVAGERFNPGQSWGGMETGLSLDENNEVHSFSMLDGTTMRWGVVDVDGLRGRAFRSSVQWATNDGYDPNAEHRGRNPSVPTPPNDQLYYDGSRNQVSFLDAPIRGGANPDRVLMGGTFRVPSWAPYAQDNSTFLMSIHAPDVAGLSAPLSIYVDRGRLIFAARSSSNNRPTQGNTENRWLHSERFSPDDVGQWWSIVQETRFSPRPEDGPLTNVWIRRGSGDWEQVVHDTGPIGYTFNGYADSGRSADDLNNGYYPILGRLYSWHRNNASDLDYPVRRMEFGFVGMINSHDVDSRDFMRTIDYHAGR